MADINVAKPFRLTLDDGATVDFKPGHHADVADHIAEHWYTKAHLVGATSTPPAGSPAAMMAEAEAAARARQDEADAADAAAAQQRAADQAAGEAALAERTREGLAKSAAARVATAARAAK